MVARPAAAAPLEDDRAILAAIERRDYRAATSALMAIHGASIYRYCRQMTGEDTLAEDVQQQVFVTAYRDLAGFAGRSTLKTWLFGIARHRCLDAVKVRRRRDRRFVTDDESTAATEDGGTPGALERYAATQLGAALTDCLDELTPTVRDAVLLRYREGFQYEEMSDLSGEKPGTLQQRVARALPVLRRCLERRLGEGANP